MTKAIWISILLAAVPAAAQMEMGHAGHDMRKMKMNPAELLLMNEASGTSMNPESWPMPMLMPRAGSWSFMVMGQAFLVDVQQSGPRGGDKFYSTNWFMGGAERKVGGGAFLADLMLSLEPATVTQRRYPEMFQTGETAFGKPIVDGQHPHNFVMGFGLHYAHPLGEHTIGEIYYAPVGDPALGPVAYPHRASAEELPQAVLGHHWQDSTHIAYNVVTVGIKHDAFRLEASGFHGQEPGENRWNIGTGKIDSWSTRLSISPTKSWMGQFSAGRLTKPESAEPGDVIRMTGSLHYTRQGWSSSVIWGRNHDTFTHRNLNSYLAESVLPAGKRNFLTGRIELVDKNELTPIGQSVRIGAYTAGYTRDIPSPLRNVKTGIGANFTAYSLPPLAKAVYGDRPFGVNVFLRFRLEPKH